MHPLRWIGFALVGLACGSSPRPPAESGGTEASGGDADAMANDPRVSRSAGVEDGLVILWPRVLGFPEAEPPALQAKLREFAAAALPDAPADVRPDPERACPREGCLGVSVGALLVAQGDECVVVAIVSEAGPSSAKLLPVMGRVNLRSPEIPFREPAESFVQVRDFAPCSELGGALEVHRAEIEAAIREAD